MKNKKYMCLVGLVSIIVIFASCAKSFTQDKDNALNNIYGEFVKNNLYEIYVSERDLRGSDEDYIFSGKEIEYFLADVTGDSQNDLIVSCADMSVMYVYSIVEDKVECVWGDSGGCEGQNLNLVKYKDRYYIYLERTSSVDGFLTKLLHFDSYTKDEKIMHYRKIIYNEDGTPSEFIVDGQKAKEKYEVFLEDISFCDEEFLSYFDFVEKYASIKEVKREESYNVNCYVKNVDLDERKIEIVPTLEISYDEYMKAITSNKVINMNNEIFSIDNSDVDEVGYCYLWDSSGTSYTFLEPTKENEKSIIYKYMKKDSIILEMNNDLKIRYGVLGFDNMDKPIGYESAGRKILYTPDEYFPNFREYTFGYYYRAEIENGKLHVLNDMFHP